MPYQFQTPSVRYPLGQDRLNRRFTYDVGSSVLKADDGTYSVVECPTSEALASAQVAYQGGHIYVVDDIEAAALTAAGLGEGLSAL